MLRSILIVALFCSTAFGAEKPVTAGSELFGVWQVVELRPHTSDNPLAKENIYFVFLPSLTMVEVVDPIESTQLPTTSLSRFRLVNSVVLASKPNQDTEEHRVTIDGTRLKFTVPFGGEILLERAP